MGSESENILEGAKCIVCGCQDASQFKPWMEVHRTTTFLLHQCQQCSFIFLPLYYRKDIDYTQYKGESVLEQVRRGNNWVKVQRQKLKFDLISKYHPKGSKLFDLGCGWGHFLLAAKELGYDIYGVEIAKHLHTYCTQDLGLPVEDINFYDLEEKEQFDVLTMWDVLEHIDEGHKFIEKCTKVVRRGGHLLIQVPQIDSFIAKKMKDSWPMISLDHVNYFTPQTLTRLLEQYGFEVAAVKSSLELKTFFMFVVFPWLKKRKAKKQSGADTSPMNSAERQQYFNTMTSRPLWQLKIMVILHNIAYKLLSFFKIGEEMVVVAKRK
ncbi:MAG: class I SAM-dependent methyltransferase [Bacteroidia bacterium]|nr:class I SAM-dependent methyltransferase [Bacteroidia bacterium]